MKNTNLLYDNVLTLFQKILFQKKHKSTKNSFLFIKGKFIAGVHILSFFYKNKLRHLDANQFLFDFVGKVWYNSN